MEINKETLTSVIGAGEWDKNFKEVISQDDLLNLLGKKNLQAIEDSDLEMVLEFFDTQQQAKEQEKVEQEEEKVKKVKRERKEKKVKEKDERKKQLEVMREKAKEEEEAAQKIADKINSSIICDNKDITKHYSRLRKSVEMTAKGYFNSSFIHGKAGTGKSYQITATLNEIGLKLDNKKHLNKNGLIDIEKNRDSYTIFSGDMSLAFLYRFLYEHNGKAIIFRDLIKLISAIRTIDILKAVTETHGSRIVQKALYSREQEDLPNDFISESRFIFEMNSLELNGFLKEDIEALLSRGDYMSLVFSFDEIADIMRQISKTDEEKEVTEFLIDNYKFVGWNNLNLRLQNKAFRIYQYAQDTNKEWKPELREFLKSELTETRRTLYTYIGERAISSVNLKRILVQTHIQNTFNLRTADRRIREWVMMRELFIVGFVSNDDEELENYLDSHRNPHLSLNPVERIEISDINDRVKEAVNQEKTAVVGVA